MPDRISNAREILANLVAFPTLSGQSNLEILDYVSRYLAGFGISAQLGYDDTGKRANLLATIGPKVDGGVALSGHTDIVPVEGQNWSSPPFELTQRGDRLFGRGSVDMKGFIACVLAQVPRFVEAPLARPVQIALSFDEEIGSGGARLIAQQIMAQPFRPGCVIVGEPTSMQLIGGHKGGCRNDHRASTDRLPIHRAVQKGPVRSTLTLSSFPIL